MRGTRRWWLSLAAVGAASTIACTNPFCNTSLELTAHGGFAYVYDPQTKMVEVAFMKSVDEDGCKVDQVGVELKIDEGKILEPLGHSPTFDVSNSVITLEGADNSGVTLIGSGRPTAPFHPADVTKDEHWQDVKWVPDTGYPATGGARPALVSDWRTSKVNGRMVLTQGIMQAGKPSDGAALLGTWKFHKESDPGGTDSKAFEQSISDRVNYRVTLSGKKVVINLSGGSVPRIVVKPSEKRGTVGVMLIGKHPPQTPVEFKVGDPITHFCAFYTLLQNPPAADQRLIPHFGGIPSTSTVAKNIVGSGGGGSPTPGAFCPGDWP
jgi:hypothetical protein